MFCIFNYFYYFRIPTSSPLGDPGMASTAALLGLHSHSRPELPPTHPLSPTYLALHSSPTSSLRLASHADYLSAAATAQRLGELQQAAQASLDVPFSLDGKLRISILHIWYWPIHIITYYGLGTFLVWNMNTPCIIVVSFHPDVKIVSKYLSRGLLAGWQLSHPIEIPSHHIKIHKLVFTAQWVAATGCSTKYSYYKSIMRICCCISSWNTLYHCILFKYHIKMYLRDK